MNSRASRRKIFLNVRIKHGLKKYLYEIALCIMCSYCDRFLVLKDVLKKITIALAWDLEFDMLSMSERVTDETQEFSSL